MPSSPTRARAGYDFERVPLERVWERVTSAMPLESPGSYVVELVAATPRITVTMRPHTHYDVTIAGKFARPSVLTVMLVDVLRRASTKRVTSADNHSEGLHTNLVWLDPVTRTAHRFDSYYATGAIQDTVNMQRALDEAMESCVPSGYTYVPMLSKHLPAFGPQVLDSSVPHEHDGEEFCVPWCYAVAQHVVSTNGAPAHECLRALLLDWKLPVPSDTDEARGAAEQYYRAIRGAVSA